MELAVDNNGGGVIISGLEGNNIHSAQKHVENETEKERFRRRRLYGAFFAIENLILAHACAGIDVTAKSYVDGIETAIDSCCNNL